MGKTIILNLTNVELKGDVLDIGKSFGVIYNLSKEIMDEISVDYISGDKSYLIKPEEYDVCTIFFQLSSLWRISDRNYLIQEITKYLKPGGEILIWDVNKEPLQPINHIIRALLPSGNIKEFEFRNINPIAISNIDDTKKSLEKFFKIEETKLWEYIYFIKATKK